MFALAAAQTAWGTDRTWQGGDGGTEANPKELYLSSNWNPSGNPGSGDILLFNVGNNNYLVAANNHTSANIANDLKVRDGNYTFLGDLQYNTFQTLDSESSRNTVIKKGDWTLMYGFRQAISADSYSVFTNASGKLDYSNEKYFHSALSLAPSL